MTKKNIFYFFKIKNRTRRDSNPQPLEPKSNALPLRHASSQNICPLYLLTFQVKLWIELIKWNLLPHYIHYQNHHHNPINLFLITEFIFFSPLPIFLTPHSSTSFLLSLLRSIVFPFKVSIFQDQGILLF